MALKVQEQSSEVVAMAQHWPIVEALLGGTAAMRAAGATFLPKWPNEEETSYKTRLSVATLFPALARTISVMGGKPFAKDVVFGEDVPAKIVDWCQDADQQGNSLHTLLADVIAEALGFGLCGVLVDHAAKPEDAKTLADERALGMRPYMVFYRHGQILGWKEKLVNGVTVLTQLRLAESIKIEDGEYGERCVRRVRVLTPGAFEVWEEGEKGDDEWRLVEGGITTLKAIPFVPFYGRKLGFMRGVSPLLDLAHLNVKHWQSQSDQDTIMHVARVPILAISGVDSQDGPKITIGSGSAINLPQGAEAKYVEHSGKAIEAGAKALKDLEEQMITTGAELLVVKPDQKSATQSNNDAEANKSELQLITEKTEDSADQVLQFMADWVKEAEGGHVSLFKDFGAGSLSDASAQLILSLQQGGLITKETALRELQRRGTLSPDIVPTDELGAVAEEGPSLGDSGDIDPETGLPRKKPKGE